MTKTEVPLLHAPDTGYERALLKIERSRWAAAQFQKFDHAKTIRITRAVADAAHAKARFYAEWAVRETGMGVVAHKQLKNEACSRGLLEKYELEDLVSPQIDLARKTVALPRPAGVIFALIPITNPVATVYFKTLLALMTRNAIILSPHPGAKNVCADAVQMLAEAAKSAGAPDGVVQIIDDPNIPLIEKLIVDTRIDLVVATGGPAVVKAAYSSGNPALGVGPGNAPVLVDDSADLKKAARRIVASKSFDNSILCTNESTLLAFSSIAAPLFAALKAEGAHICSFEETASLRQILFTNAGLNASIIGKDAEIIAREAGFAAPNAKILVTPIDLVQPEEHLAQEKLCPVLAFSEVGDLGQAISSARSMMRKAGRGHSAAIHSQREENIMAFTAALPALRVVVNAGCSLGASGFETNLGPSMTIGTGFAGGSSLSENLSPRHFVQFATIAYNKDSAEIFGNYEGLKPFKQPERATLATTKISTSATSDADELRQMLRKIILEELNAVMVA